MDFEQPKPDSKNYSNLINEVQKKIIKIPKFQRDFVWDINKTAELLDSILKGYPIGTFILWETGEQINGIRNIGNWEFPDVPERATTQYVLDGQQRITSLLAAYLGAKIQKVGERKETDYKGIVVNLGGNMSENDDQIITATPTGDKFIPLYKVLNFTPSATKELKRKFNLDDDDLDIIHEYERRFNKYNFSTVILRKEDIYSAIEVFTRINTSGKLLTLFEIMSAKTYDEKESFDMQERWEDFIKELDDSNYESISSTVILSLLALVLSRTKECNRKTILDLDKKKIIDGWNDAIDALRNSISYFRRVYRIPVSQLLPYDSLLVPLAYFLFHEKDGPKSNQHEYLEEFFWRMSLSYRYSNAADSRLAQDIKRIDLILAHQRPDYSDINVRLDSPQTLIDVGFSAGDSYCKAILCLLASQGPKDFRDNGKVILDNSLLKAAHSKNYHHFFPKKYLKKQGISNINSLINITLVSDLNKRKIGARAPSDYIGDFKNGNSKINDSLKPHFIGLNGFGIDSDDYNIFLHARAKWIFDELKARIDLSHKKSTNEEIQELIAAGESGAIEFKSTLRYDLQLKKINKKLEYAVAKAIAAFLNSEGGDLIIGVDDARNALGLSNDIDILLRKDSDGFERCLIEVIKNYIGVEYSTHIKITFPTYDGTEICRTRVKKSSKPVFIRFDDKEYFFVRIGCSSQPLGREAQSNYEKEHWGN